MASTAWWGRGRSPAVPVMVIAGFLLSLLAFLQVRQASREAERSATERQAVQLNDALKERIDRHVLLLRALSGPLAGPAPVTQAGFTTLTEPLLPYYPALHAVVWAQRIPASQVSSLERAARADGRPQFTVRSASGAASPPDRDLFVNVLVEPRPVIDQLIGLDIRSLPGRPDPLAQACRSGDIVSLDGSTLPDREDHAPTTNIYMPVYARDSQAGDGEFRCDALSGFLWAAFRLDHLLREVVEGVGLTIGDAYLLDVEPAPAGWSVRAAESGKRERAEPFQPLPPERLAEIPVIEHAIEAGGRFWRLLVVPSPSPLFDPRDRLAWMVLGVGLLLTGGLVAYVRHEARAKRLLQSEARARAAMARALRESEERFRLALRHSRVALYSQDRRLRYVWIYSPQTLFMPEDYIGSTHADLYNAQDAERLDKIKRSVLETGIGAREEVHLTTAGRRQVLDLSVEPMRDDSGAVSGVICAAIDVTEASEIRRALGTAHAEAERANQAKSRFLAAASHDLRQPFQAMSLFHHILVSKLTDPQQLEVAAKLGEALTTGNALLSTLLDTSALEVGNVKPRVVDFSIGDIVARLSTEITDQAIDRGLSLRVVPCSARVRSDPILLERMLRNLLVNALRYTVEGRILMGCRRRDDRLVVEVWDTGPGIPADQMSAIFEDFYRCGTDQRDSARGLGLGLSIVRRTAQILDHPVNVRSRVGHGTVFSISVPLSSKPPPSQAS